MEVTGTLAGLSEDLVSGTAQITFNIKERGLAVRTLPRMKDKELRISVKQYRNKRSLNANAYYYSLVGKMAEILHVSKPYIHNRMLRKYGQFALLDGKPIYLSIKDTEAIRKEIEESEDYHLRPTEEVRQGKDGNQWRTYLMIKGSHEYDTKEMSELIDGVVSEAQELGIETITPDEIKRMVAAW